MLDGILGRNFSAKCKASIKVIRTRIDVIRRKRNATQKFLKKDVADLLANGLDINAYGRAEGLIAELTISSCYDFIERSCECVLKHLSVMQKQSECPEECRTAVASLMFAAARFSDLPELRDLRHVFQERYGNNMECYVNQKFVENLSSNPSTMENKIQLMNSIASEFSIKWDSRAFERTICKAPVCVQEPPKQYRLFNAIDEKQKTPNDTNTILNVNKLDVLPKERHEVTRNGHVLHIKKDDTAPKRENLDDPFSGRRDSAANGNKPVNGRGDSNPLRDGREILFNGREQLGTKRPEILAINEVESQTKTHGLSSSSIGNRDEPTNGGYKQCNGLDKFPFGSRHNNANRDNNDGGIHKVTGSSSGDKRPEPKTVDGGRYALHKDQFFKGDERDNPFARRFNGAVDHKVVSSSSREKRLEPDDDGYVSRNLQPKNDENCDILLASKKKYPGRDKNCADDRDMPFAITNNHRPRYDDYADQHEVAYSIQKTQAEKADGVKLYNNSVPPPYGNSIQKVQAEKKDEVKPCYNAIPPPYVKPPRDSKRGTSLGNKDPVFYYDGPNKSSASEKSEKILLVSDHGRDKQHKLHLDEIAGDILPKPRSVRRRHSKSSSSSNTDINNSEERRYVKRVTSGRRRGDPRQGLQLVIDGEDEQYYHKDEEERMMDKLLLFYSTKPTIYDETEMLNRKGNRPDNSIKHEHDEISVVLPPPRSTSLPRGHPGPSEVKKVYARAASFQPDRSSPAQHVHPKLPDYDDLAARFAALKGR